MDFWIKAAQLILSLSILVILHEFGHFIPARIFKTRVEKFYLFFDPWFSLFKKKIGETEWGIGWLPFGGYVKISGMVDESMDTEQLAKPAEPWEFRSKPAWQRLIIMIGGVTVNLLLGIFIYICIMFAYGEDQLRPQDLKAGMAIHPYMKKFGLNSGDNILAVNGEKIKNVTDVNNMIFLRDGHQLTVLHPDGNRENITLPGGVEYELFQNGAMQVVSLRCKVALIDSVIPKKPAFKAGLKKGDRIIRVNNQKVDFLDESQAALYQSKGKKAELEVLRDGKLVKLESSVLDDGTIGIQFAKIQLLDEKSIQHLSYGFGESIGRGIDKGFHTLSDYVGQLKFLFTKKGASSIGGFGAIGNMFPATWDWQIFWMNTALISIILAFMNILPIPALDGGHVVFLLYEIITGKEAPQKVLEYAQMIGIVLLLSLLIYANGNDIFRWLFGG